MRSPTRLRRLAALFAACALAASFAACQKPQPKHKETPVAKWVEKAAASQQGERGAMAKDFTGMTPEAKAAILDLAKSPDAATRRGAIVAAGLMGAQQPGAVDAAVAALEDDDPGVRTEAIWACGMFGEAAEPAVPALRAMLAGNDPEERVRAANVVPRIGTPALPLLPLALMAVAGRGDDALIDYGQRLSALGLRALPEVENAWKESGVDDDRAFQILRTALMASLAPQGSGLVLTLAEALRHPDPVMRRAASEPFFRMGAKGAAAGAQLATIYRMEVSQPGIIPEGASSAVPEVLAAVMGEKALPELKKGLKAKAARTRIDAANGCARLGSGAREAFNELAALLEDDDPAVRAAGENAIKQIK